MQRVDMTSIDNNKMTAFVNACHKVTEYGLVKCSSGNMSWRIDDGVALLSASRSWLAEITPEQTAACNIQTGECVNGKTPTCESVFHLGILASRPDQNVILHFQSPYATAIACADPTTIAEYNFNVIIEIPVYIGKPAIVPYLPPGSAELAEATIEAMKTHNMAILANHGLVTVGKSFNDAIQKAAFFELSCRILLSKVKTEPIPDDAAQKLRQAGVG